MAADAAMTRFFKGFQRLTGQATIVFGAIEIIFRHLAQAGREIGALKLSVDSGNPDQ